MTSKLQRVSLVTGVSSGIGLSVAKTLLDEGDIVYGISRRTSEDVDSLSIANSSFTFKALDVTDLDLLRNLLRQIWSAHKSLNLVVNSAGIPHGGLLSLTKPEVFEDVFRVNFFAPIFLAQLSSRYLSKSHNPHIIFISSSSSFRFDPGTLAYASSKSALNYAAKQLSFEYAGLGIRVNCIAPGVTNTPMLSHMSPRAVEKQLASAAIPAICQPSQIASLVTYLNRSEARHINGQVLRIDGGLP